MLGHAVVCGLAAILSQVAWAPVGGGNALTLPAQRHVVRLSVGGSPVWLVALQQDGADGHGLGLFRSDDEGASYRYYAPIQNDWSERDTADLLPLGADLALVYSYEGPTLSGSSRHNVFFQRWRAAGNDLVPDDATQVLASPSDATAYSRAELAVDSLGRIWVTAFRLESDGSSSLAITVSTDGGRTFTRQPDLDSVPHRGGGRMLSLGSRLMIVYAMHDGLSPSRYIVRDDSAPLASWGPVQQAFPEGIYHGAALSAVATPEGGMHLVYKNENDEHLYYRYFDGAAFGEATQVDDSSDWALQPAITLVGGALAIFYNHVDATNTNYQMRVRWLSNGSFSDPQGLTPSPDFKGYPGAAAVLPASIASVPVFYSDTPTSNDPGSEAVVTAPNPAQGPAPDAGAADAGAVDSGSPPGDAGAPDAGGRGSGAFDLAVTYTDTDHVILAVDPAGTVYSTQLSDSPSNLYASSDGRTWALRGTINLGNFSIMTALSDGTLIADLALGSGGHGLARSADQGVTWTQVLDLGPYQTLTSHSFAELDGTAFLIEYQTFVEGDAPIQLWASADRGRTWSVRSVFQGHRHGHGVRADAAHHALWVYFGDTDSQSGIYRSTDMGNSWTLLLAQQPGDVVDAEVLPDGSLLFGQDISFLPTLPHVGRLTPDGTYTELTQLSGPSYAIHALSGGGFVVGVEREPGGDIYGPDEVSAHLVTSPDGVQFSPALDYPRLSDQDNARADIYWELPTGELLLQLENAQGFGPQGKGYQILQVNRR